jgi:very-short-patch-repair endonuclease
MIIKLMKLYANNNKHLKKYSTALRNHSTLSEALLWNCLKNNQLGYRFTRQKIIENYIVDFYCPKLKLVIEIDGSTHESKIIDDIKRDLYLESKNIKVLRIGDDDVKNNLDGVVNYITEYIKKSLSS